MRDRVKLETFLNFLNDFLTFFCFLLVKLQKTLNTLHIYSYSDHFNDIYYYYYTCGAWRSLVTTCINSLCVPYKIIRVCNNMWVTEWTVNISKLFNINCSYETVIQLTALYTPSPLRAFIEIVLLVIYLDNRPLQSLSSPHVPSDMFEAGHGPRLWVRHRLLPQMARIAPSGALQQSQDAEPCC